MIILLGTSYIQVIAQQSVTRNLTSTNTVSTYIIDMIIVVVVLCFIFILTKKKERKELHQVIEKYELIKNEVEMQVEDERKRREQVEMKMIQMDEDMKRKSCELADSTMNLKRKNDMLKSLDNNMQELSEYIRQYDSKSIVSKKVVSMRRSIKKNMAEDDKWEKFQENFNLVYNDYMKKLIIRYPDLTKSDRKLCAYLRMGLSSKEMSTLLNTSVRSIETARYRLRRKMELENGENLVSFIQNLG